MFMELNATKNLRLRIFREKKDLNQPCSMYIIYISIFPFLEI